MTFLGRHLFLFLSLLLAALLLLPMASSELGRDQSNWLTVAMALEDGRVMYRDVAVVNTPGLGVIFALVNALTDTPTLTPWIVHSLTVLVTILSGYILVFATAGRAAASGAAVLTALLWPQTMQWWELAQKDGVAFMFALSAMAAFAHKPDNRLLNALAGALLAAAVFTKTSAAIYLLPCAALLVLETRSMGDLIRRAAWITLGGIGFVLLPGLYLTLHDAWPDAKASLVDRAIAYGGFQRKTAPELLYALARIVASDLSMVLLLPVVLLRVPSFATKLPVSVIIMLLTTILAFTLQGRGAFYHAVPVVASTGLLLGACLGLIFENQQRLQKGVAAMLVVVAVFISGYQYTPRLVAQATALAGYAPPDWRNKWFIGGGMARPDESRQMAAWIKARTEPDDLIFIWGMESQIYILSDRMFVGPSFADAPIWHPQLAAIKPAYFEAKIRTFLNDITATPPKVFVVARNDSNPVEPMASDDALRTRPDLSAFIDAHYTLQFSTPNLLAYQLN